MNKKFHFLYKTTSTFNGKFYIGIHSTDNLEDGYLGSGRRLLKDIKSYGKDKYEREILEFFNTREELEKREAEIVTPILMENWYCLNVAEGGNNYKKGDKLYYKGFDLDKWGDIKWCILKKDDLTTDVVKELVEYYEKLGWVDITDKTIKLIK